MADFKYLHTTEIPVATTASQMMAVLGILGASNVSMSMDHGEPSGMTFTVAMGGRTFTYKLPVRWQPIHHAMVKEAEGMRGSYDQRKRRLERAEAQAKRTAWRLALDWLKVQAAFVQNGIRHPAEVFMADMVIQGDGEPRTVGEVFLETQRFPMIGMAGN